MFACMGFIFLSLLELAAVAFQDKLNEIHVRRLQKVEKMMTTLSDRTAPSDAWEKSMIIPSRKAKQRLTYKLLKGLKSFDTPGMTIDKYSSILFPFAFACFNVCYWGYYLR